MAALPIVEAFDESEDRASRLGLCLEPGAIEQLAFERGEEALAHGVVVCVADRTHRGTHACVTTAMAELDRSANPGRSDGSRRWVAVSSVPCSERPAPVVWRAW